MSRDAGEDVCQPGLGGDGIHFCRDDETVHSCGTLTSAIGPAEQPGFSPQGNHPFILPVLGTTSRFIIAGTRCTAGEFVCITVRSELVLG
jgi:hypothetical protein